MVLGFISLLLTFGQNYFARICIHERFANTMLPCPLSTTDENSNSPPKVLKEHHRRLLWYEHRMLASGGGHHLQCKEGYVPVISVNALHQLHIFIFFLAICHVIFSAITMTLGRAKIRGWKEWEREVAQDYELDNDPTRFRLTKETSFVRDHTSFMLRTPVLFYIVCFYRQFFRSVRKADYLTMRHGFISNAFEITYFIWITYEFGLYSCFHESIAVAIIRVAIGLAVQVLCSYITLPLYALVTQMGSTMKQSIFDEQTSKALKNWTKHAKKQTGKTGQNQTQASGGTVKGSSTENLSNDGPGGAM